MSKLRIHLLGPPEIRHGEILSFRSAKALALLAYLATEGKMEPRATLAALFWPESDATRARANLRNTLNYLRNGLPRTADGATPHLMIERNMLGIDPTADIFLDVDRVREALATRRPQALAEAVALYHDDFMAGFSLPDAPAFDAWITFQREQWHRHLDTIFARLAHLQTENSRLTEALATTTQWLSHAPLNEAAHRQMMTLSAGTGRRHEALAQYERCRRLLEDELGVEPDPRTTALYERISQGAADAPPSSPPTPLTRSTVHNLPAPTTPFIGRDAERALLHGYLDDTTTRLVTLTGPGGIGKTRLALQAARESSGRFLDGVWLVTLAEVQDWEQLVTMLADVLGVQFSGRAEPRTQLLSFLQEQEMLLMLDNFEQLLPVGAALLDELLRRAPKIELLVTSRVRLNLQAEQVVALDGLPPEEGQALFVTAARRADAAFWLKPDMKTAVAHIVDLVGGLPLGLQLAAAWVRLLSPAEIVAELQGNLDLLAADRHDAPDRHRSLRAVFDASWRRLSSSEKKALRRLSVCHGGFTRAAADAVAAAPLPLLASLVEKSLLQRQGPDRYTLHPLLRTYAAEKLAAHPQELETAVAAHSGHFITWLGQQETVLLRGERPDEAVFAEIEADVSNIRRAWEMAVARRQTHTLGPAALPLGIYYDLRGQLQEWQALLDPAVTQLASAPPAESDKTEALGRLLIFYGLVASRRGDQVAARTILQRASEKLAGTSALRGMALNFLALANLQQGDVAATQATAREALRLNEESDNLLGISLARNVLGLAAAAAGDIDEARRYLARAVTQWRRVQSKHGEARARIHLGFATYALGKPEEAHTHLQAALSLGEQINDRTLRPLALGHLGMVRYGQGRYPAARRHFQSTLEESLSSHLLPYAIYAIGGLGLLAAVNERWETAVTVLTFFRRHPLAMEAFLRGEDMRRLAEMETELGAAVYAAAQARGEAATIEEIKALIDESI